ncbi:hypothetical protein [Salinibacterium sp. GXW1014]|uniref:hypothetical protein n=1 Tax=Salinibacterium sp. GXW1014 TaxID=3377838 RepID=UPI00383BBBDE
MSIATTAPSSTSSDLPRGFDDPSSPHFVPEPLRPHYSRKNRQPNGVDDAARSLAWAFARQTVQERLGLSAASAERFPTQEYLDEVAATAHRMLREDYRELTDRALHDQLLAAAHAAHAHAEQNKEILERNRRTTTCPVCGQCDPVRNGGVQTRSVLPETVARARVQPNPHPSIRSCVACYVLLVDAYKNALASEPLEDWRAPTRRDAVLAALQPHLPAKYAPTP